MSGVVPIDEDPLTLLRREQVNGVDALRRIGGDEQRHLREEARVAGVAVHVTGREDDDEEADERDRHQHDRRQPVGAEREPDLQSPKAAR